MGKLSIEQFAETISKYSLAIAGVLYPSQVEELYNALEHWKSKREFPEIDCVVVRLAFLMIVSDFLYQERNKKE